MNDVLPKPFTRQSLLAILEKQLVHLKGMHGAMDAPPPGPVSAMPQNSATQSVKDEHSPGQSPGTTMGNWQSPGQFQGLSPINPNMGNQFINPGSQAQTPSFVLDHNGGVQFATTQLGVMNAPSSRPQHRRQLSDMSSPTDANNFSKRQRMFVSANNTPVVNPMQTNRML
jgi:osomolarity two-component system response regulator SKN7